MKKKILCILFAEFVCISLLTTGCKRSSQPIDANMVFFEKSLPAAVCYAFR